jgi:uncharacterized protein (TIGR02217 family)
MSFNESRLSDRVALGFQAVPFYSTRIVTLDNGREKRNVNWTKAKRRFMALFQGMTETDFAELAACFHAQMGAAYPFRFKDWTDYRVTQGSIGDTPGANTTAVQLVKIYTFGSRTTTRNITKPVNGTVVVYQADGAGGWATKAGTLDASTGLFTPSTNWTAARALRASFEFDVPVRFGSDEFPASYENRNALNATCELVEDFL